MLQPQLSVVLGICFSLPSCSQLYPRLQHLVMLPLLHRLWELGCRRQLRWRNYAGRDHFSSTDDISFVDPITYFTCRLTTGDVVLAAQQNTEPGGDDMLVDQACRLIWPPESPSVN